jgi:hypothetical protein
MQRQGSVLLIQRVLFAFLLLTVSVLTGRQHYGEAHGDGEEEGHHQAEQVCRGFVILPNGFAVLSSLPLSSVPGSASAHHDAAHGSVTMADKGRTSGAPQHLLGYTHGQEVMLQEDMLCIPIVTAGAQRWTAVSQKGAPTVTVESFPGALKSGSRVNATFALTIRQGDVPVEPAQVRLLARMPHHDRHLPGGHGPANDPDVQGIMAQPVRPGRYTIPTVDFTMDGPWLFEVHIQRGAETHKAYFAAYVGEE